MMISMRTTVALVIAVAVFGGACAQVPGKPHASPSHGATTATAAPRPKGFVALGDSYTSGGGATPYDVDLACVVSSQSWPNQLVKLEPRLHLIQNRACGGAQTKQLLQPWPQRGRQAQISRTPDDSVGLVAFTIGGNDLHMAQTIASCFTADCAGAASSRKAWSYLDALQEQLVMDVYPALRRAYPRARLIHVGYPLLTSEDAGKSCPWLAPEERAEPTAIVNAINGAIRTAASESSRIEYVDVAHAFAGHELCTRDSWVYDLADERALHPTAAGYAALAAVIDRALRR